MITYKVNKMDGTMILIDFAITTGCLVGIALCISRIIDEVTTLQWLRGDYDWDEGMIYERNRW